MKSIIIAVVVLAASIAESASADSWDSCARSVLELKLTRAGYSAGQEQPLLGYTTAHPYTPVLESAPQWMRAKRADWGCYRKLELWGVPRSGTYTVFVRHPQSDDIIYRNTRIGPEATSYVQQE